MLITRFHKLIQSKVVWYIILGVIVVSFVGFFTPTMRSADRQRKSSPAGELFGKKVSQEEYNRARQNSYIWEILSTGRMVPMTEERVLKLRENAWLRVAALRKAQAEKILITDKEVVQQLQMMPLFHAENGTFDPARYKGVLQNIGLTPQQVENVFREQLGIYKLMYRPVQAALISPYELKRAYHLYTDRFVLDYVLLPREQIEKTVTVPREDAEALFNENPEAFRMPAKVRVSYVEFPVSSFMEQAEVPEGAALQVYNRNIEDYRIETTNENAVVEYKPFEEVETEITKELREFSARRLAAAKATEFVVEVSPKNEGAQPDFAGAAAAAGLKVKTLPAFGVKDDLPSIDDTAPFRQTAFSLQKDAYSSFSDAVIGKDSVYVLSLEQQYPSFLPSFAAVEKEVTEAAREQAVARKLAGRAIEIRDAAAKALAGGSDFKAAVKPSGLKVRTTPEFDLSTELKDEYADTLVELCLNVPQGGLCEPAPVKAGVLIAYVAGRKSTDADAGLPAIRQELVDGLSRARAQRLAAGWQASLLREGGFKNLMDSSVE
jgi:peptidyl-prolyl cis-trans isomerase D